MHEGHHHGILDKAKPQKKGTAHSHAHGHDHDHDHGHAHEQKNNQWMKLVAGGIVAVIVVSFVIWKLL